MSAVLQRHYKLRPSRNLSLVVCIACLLSLATLFHLFLDLTLHLLLSFCVFLVCARVLLRDAMLGFADSCVAFRIERSEDVTMVLRNGTHRSGRLMAGSVLSPFLVLLNVRLEDGAHRGVVLLKDNMDADSFRHLRVLLRWGAKQTEPISSV
jgi:toxin CptA